MSSLGTGFDMRAVFIFLMSLSFASFGGTIAKAQEVTFLMSHYLRDDGPGLHQRFLAPFAQSLVDAGQGRIAVEMETAGSWLGLISQQYEQTFDGLSDISFGLQGNPRGRFPCSQVIELPFLTDSATEANEALWRLYETHLRAEYSGARVLALMAHDPGVLATKNVAVREPEDLAGLRIRVPSPFVARLMRDLGAEPILAPPDEILEALSEGAIDGLVMPWAGLTEFNLFGEVTNVIEIAAYTTPFYLIMNQDLYDSLPQDIAAIVDSVSGEMLVDTFPQGWDQMSAVSKSRFLANGGVVIENGEFSREAWIEAAAPIVSVLEAEIAAECGQKLVDAARELTRD